MDQLCLFDSSLPSLPARQERRSTKTRALTWRPRASQRPSCTVATLTILATQTMPGGRLKSGTSTTTSTTCLMTRSRRWELSESCSNNKYISNAPNLSLTIHGWSSRCYWAIQVGLLTPLTFAQHRLSPLAAFTSGAYFLHIGRRWQWICEFYTANFKGIFGSP